MSIRSIIAKFIARPDVQSVARHAVIAAGAVLIPVLVSGTPLSLALIVSAGAAGLRVLWIALEAEGK